MIADLIDVQGYAKYGKKWKAYPRPLKTKDTSKSWGDLVDPETGKVRTRAEVVAILNGLGHSLPV